MGCPVCGSINAIINKTTQDVCAFCGATLFSVGGQAVKLICNGDVEEIKKEQEDKRRLIYGDAENFVINGETLVQYCGSSEIVVIPDKVKSIGAKAFSHNYNLRKIIIPKGVKVIEDPRDLYKGAFSECPFLSHIIFQEQSQLEDIGIGTFSFSSESEEVKEMLIENFPIDMVKRIGRSAVNTKMYQTLKQIYGEEKIEELGLSCLLEGKEWIRR